MYRAPEHDIVYTRVFDQDVILLNSEEAAVALLSKRYSDRPEFSPASCTFCYRFYVLYADWYTGSILNGRPLAHGMGQGSGYTDDYCTKSFIPRQHSITATSNFRERTSCWHIYILDDPARYSEHFTTCVPDLHVALETAVLTCPQVLSCGSHGSDLWVRHEGWRDVRLAHATCFGYRFECRHAWAIRSLYRFSVWWVRCPMYPLDHFDMCTMQWRRFRRGFQGWDGSLRLRSAVIWWMTGWVHRMLGLNDALYVSKSILMRVCLMEIPGARDCDAIHGHWYDHTTSSRRWFKGPGTRASHQRVCRDTMQMIALVGTHSSRLMVSPPSIETVRSIVPLLPTVANRPMLLFLSLSISCWTTQKPNVMHSWRSTTWSGGSGCPILKIDHRCHMWMQYCERRWDLVQWGLSVHSITALGF